VRKSKQEAAETRRRIVTSASSEFRRNGLAGTGLNDLMGAAGLTHGGFYKHFESKEQVVDEALAQGIESMVEAWGKTPSKSSRGIPKGVARGNPLEAAIADYLSPEHCADVADGCPYAALGSELTRAGAAVRDTATRGILKMVDLIAANYPDITPGAARKKALWTISSMIGAVTVARMVNDPAVSATILREARKHLADQ
jgi:TetR/AcrR family transcriptional regulator, transcriptional repressor for nem operon